MSETIQVARFGRIIDVPKPQGAAYSGAERTGLCSCSHAWDRHHLQPMVGNQRLEEFNEMFIPGECLDCAVCAQYKDTGSENLGA